jgi:hypothetical protein
MSALVGKTEIPFQGRHDRWRFHTAWTHIRHQTEIPARDLGMDTGRWKLDEQLVSFA